MSKTYQHESNKHNDVPDVLRTILVFEPTLRFLLIILGAVLVAYCGAGVIVRHKRDRLSL